jgi:hypothetical protein
VAPAKSQNGIFQCLHVGKPQVRGRGIATAKLPV